VVSPFQGSNLVHALDQASFINFATTAANTTIQHCLVNRAPPATCKINLNPPLLGMVALPNSITVVATAAVLFKRSSSSSRPLATLGDAIASFLFDPDPTTQGACLLSKSDIRRGCWPPFAAQARYWVPRNHFWFRSVSGPRWLVSVSVWSITATLAAGAFGFTLMNEQKNGQSLFSSPLGTPSGSPPRALYLLPANIPPPASAVLVTLLPQLLLALLYLAANSLLSQYWLSHESSLFAPLNAHRPLRVSCPDPYGLQRTSARLTLPRWVSGLLGVMFAGMAFGLSQGVFGLAVEKVDVGVRLANLAGDPGEVVDSQPHLITTIVTLSFNSIGLLILVCLLGLLLALVIALGLRRAPRAGLGPGNPMALVGGSCSAVISSRCHPLMTYGARDPFLAGRRIAWGVVSDGVHGPGVTPGYGHCGFTAGAAGMVEAGRNYA
jgi:hypothetical protein